MHDLDLWDAYNIIFHAKRFTVNERTINNNACSLPYPSYHDTLLPMIQYADNFDCNNDRLIARHAEFDCFEVLLVLYQ